MKCKKWYIKPVVWSVIFLIIAQALTILSVYQQQPFLDDNDIVIPEQPTEIVIWPTETVDPNTGVVTPPTVDDAASSVGGIVLYFVVMIVLLSVILAVIPLKALSAVFRCIFALLFAWGIFILLVVWIPWDMALGISISVAAIWFVYPAVWLHDVVMLIAMVSIASLFGRFINPWTAMIIMTLMAIYDFIAVKKGLMLWLVDKMAHVNTLPAFVIPSEPAELSEKLNAPNVKKLAGQTPNQKDYSLLGGGDIAFPLIVTSACFFKYGIYPTLIISGASIVGLIAVYIIQSKVLHGKPMAALPPLTVSVLIAFLGIVFTH